MFKILFVFFCIVSNIFSETFGKDVEIEGFWRIDAAKEGYNIEIASSVGTRMALKFDKNGKVYIVNYKTLKPDSYPLNESHSWEVIKDGIIHIAFNNKNENIIGNFVFNSHFNNYLKIFKKTSSNCYHIILQNGNNQVHQWGAIMCKASLPISTTSVNPGKSSNIKIE